MPSPKTNANSIISFSIYLVRERNKIWTFINVHHNADTVLCRTHNMHSANFANYESVNVQYFTKRPEGDNIGTLTDWSYDAWKMRLIQLLILVMWSNLTCTEWYVLCAISSLSPHTHKHSLALSLSLSHAFCPSFAMVDRSPVGGGLWCRLPTENWGRSGFLQPQSLSLSPLFSSLSLLQMFPLFLLLFLLHHLD